VGARAPELLANSTVAPGTTTLLEFLTMAVMVAGVEPFEAICGELATSVIDAAVAEVPEPLLLLLELELANELASLPPQPARASTATKVPKSQP